MFTLIFTGPAKLEKANADNERVCKKLLEALSSSKLHNVLEKTEVPAEEKLNGKKVAKVSG